MLCVVLWAEYARMVVYTSPSSGNIIPAAWGPSTSYSHCCCSLKVCLAYRNGEPRVVVVMSQRPKLEMEATFRRIIPAEQRFGTRFVFREGSAIIPDNLRMVAASRAAATIIVSDSSR